MLSMNDFDHHRVPNIGYTRWCNRPCAKTCCLASREQIAKQNFVRGRPPATTSNQPSQAAKPSNGKLVSPLIHTNHGAGFCGAWTTSSSSFRKVCTGFNACAFQHTAVAYAPCTVMQSTHIARGRSRVHTCIWTRTIDISMVSVRGKRIEWRCAAFNVVV